MKLLAALRLRGIYAGRMTGQGAGILFYARDTGRFLFVKRSETCDQPNTWACLGGGVEDGESVLEGALRECWEEGGYKPGPDLKILPMYKSEQPNFTYHNHIGLVDKEFEPVLNDEHTEHQWASPLEFPEPLLPAFEDALRKGEFAAVLGY